MIWGCDHDEIALHAVLRTWMDSTAIGKAGALQARIAKESQRAEESELLNRRRLLKQARADAAMDKALLRWGSDQDALQLHAVLRPWMDTTALDKAGALRARMYQEAQERVNKQARHDEAVVDKALLKWGDECADVKLQVI